MKHGKLSLLLSTSVAVALAGCASSSAPKGPINENGSAPYLVPVKVEASSHDGNGPERLIDGDIETRWSASGAGETAILDYGQVTEFDAVRASFSKGDQRSTYFDVEVSEDGTTWTKVLSGQQSSGETNTLERFPFAPVKARYVKYVGQGNSKNTWNSVTEFNAVNCKINTCTALEFINSDSLAALAAAAPTVKMERNDNPDSAITNWKLTVPVTNAGLYGAAAQGAAADAYYKLQGTGADSAGEILPKGCSLDGSSLSDATNNAYFKVDKAGWHFRTPLEGGTSTPNSTYIRTELRELTTGWNPCEPTPLANWAYGGTHTLAATVQLNEVPATPLKKDGKTPDAPKVVLGQIHAHDINAATVKLLWEGDKKPVRVILNKTTTKSAFSVKLGVIPDPTQPWVYIIKMTDEGIELSAGGVTKTLKFGQH
ncbi:polysaccharide lyase family 7 protein [Psychromonas sp.]|nr:polysaccharide lyase family 7 protein [Psychromonas sp.]